MQIWSASPLLGGSVQSVRHVVELFIAFGLTHPHRPGTNHPGQKATDAFAGVDGVVAVLRAGDEAD